MSRCCVIAAIIALAVVGFACGKRRVDPALENRETRPVWDPPTEANGFHAVAMTKCLPHEEGVVPIARSSNGTLENVAIDEQTYRGHGGIAADKSAIYWTEGGGGGGGGGNLPGVLRASRTDPQRAWQVERIAERQGDPGEIAVNDRFVYWAIGEKPGAHHEASEAPGIRFLDKATKVVGRLATEVHRPDRIVADGDSVFWIASPNHVREGRGSGSVRDVFAVSSLNPNILAVDHASLYAFTDQTLLRIPRDGGASVVLVSTTMSAPIDMAVNGPWVYWLEGGAPFDSCGPHRLCGCNYGAKRLAHPQGSLRRIPKKGGPIQVIVTNLPEVQKLTFLHGLAFIVTDTGLLRVDPTSGATIFVEEGDKTALRATTIGDALVLGVRENRSRIALLSRP